MVVVIWSEIWYNIGRQMRLREERFDWRLVGEVVDTTSVGWHGEKLPRGIEMGSVTKEILMPAAEEKRSVWNGHH